MAKDLLTSFERKTLGYTLKLHEKVDAARNEVQKVIEYTEEFIQKSLLPYVQNEVINEMNDYFSITKDKLNVFFQDSQDQSCIKANVKKEFDEISKNVNMRVRILLSEISSNCLQKFNTEAKRFSMYRKYSSYEDPISYKIGDDTKFIIINREVITVEKTPVHGHIMSIESPIKSLLESPDVWRGTKAHIKQLYDEKKVISNVLQADLWQKKYLKAAGHEVVNSSIVDADEIDLPIVMYNDDFETGCGLGSHAGEQELSAVFVLLPFLPPNLAVKIDNIFVAAVFYKKHRKQFGPHAVMYPVIKYLNKFCSSPLKIVAENNKIVKIRFKVILLLGDNLALNCLFGFVESFSATRYCRICRATRTQCHHLFVEDKSLLRTIKNYETDLKSNNSSTGIKSNSVINELTDFHLIHSRYLDLMHDWFGGGVKYVLSGVLTGLIDIEKIIPLSEVNSRMKKFPFGEVESSNRPRELIRDTSKKQVRGNKIKISIKVKQSAAETLCLVRTLGLIIGDVIKDEKNKYWQMYVTLRQAIGIVTGPSYQKSDMTRLRILTARLLEQYYECVGPLKPKLHFFTHTPETMLLIGPLIHLWCMGPERKNKQLRGVAIRTSSHVDLPLTVAIKLQLYQTYIREVFRNCPTEEYALGSYETKNDRSVQLYFPRQQIAQSFNFVKLFGKIYRIGSIVQRGANDEGPIFGKVIKIFLINNNIYFILSYLKTIYFDSKYHAYKVIFDDHSLSAYNSKIITQIRIGSCMLVERENNLLVQLRYD